MDNRIIIVKNSAGEESFALKTHNPIALYTDRNHVYRSTGMDQIEDIANCGYVRTKGFGIRAKSRGEIVYWTIGGKVSYYSKQPILETSTDKLKDGQIGALPIDDLTGIWIFDETNNKYVNEVDKYKKEYAERINRKMSKDITTTSGEKVSYKSFLEKIIYPNYQDKMIMISDEMGVSIKDYFEKVVTPNINEEDINYDNIMNICKSLLIVHELEPENKKGPVL